MSASVSAITRYRRHAQQCLEMARVFKTKDARAALIEMAQVWQRLADQREYSSTFLLFGPHGGERPVMQQQAQIQPDDKE